MENLEKKSLTQKLKQNSKNIFYSLALILIFSFIIVYATRPPERITSIMTQDIQSGDKITSDWVKAVNNALSVGATSGFSLNGCTQTCTKCFLAGDSCNPSGGGGATDFCTKWSWTCPQ